MSGDEVSEKFIDCGWTAQIQEVEQEILEIETKIANHVSSIRPLEVEQRKFELN